MKALTFDKDVRGRIGLMLTVTLIFERRLIHIGTIANMTLIGYTGDFCLFLWEKFLPPELFTGQPQRTILFAAALIPFLVCSALYVNADMGLAPYDSVPMIIHHRTGWPYAPVRMVCDACAILVGILAGGRLTIGTVCMALFAGPTVALIDKLMKKRKTE